MAESTNTNEPSTSASLLQLARDGDPDGWSRLAQIYGPIVYAWARKCGCQTADAADVMQETFASVTKAIGRFDHDRPGATFRGWLWTIARNKIRDQARDDQAGLAMGGTDANLKMQNVAADPSQPPSEPPSEPPDEPPSENASDIASVRRRTVELMRESFDPRSWRMFWETTIIGRDAAEVAKEMDVSRWAVYKARARVLQRLQQEMKGLE